MKRDYPGSPRLVADAASVRKVGGEFSRSCAVGSSGAIVRAVLQMLGNIDKTKRFYPFASRNEKILQSATRRWRATHHSDDCEIPRWRKPTVKKVGGTIKFTWKDNHI